MFSKPSAPMTYSWSLYRGSQKERKRGREKERERRERDREWLGALKNKPNASLTIHHNLPTESRKRGLYLLRPTRPNAMQIEKRSVLSRLQRTAGRCRDNEPGLTTFWWRLQCNHLPPTVSSYVSVTVLSLNWRRRFLSFAGASVHRCRFS